MSISFLSFLFFIFIETLWDDKRKMRLNEEKDEIFGRQKG